MNRSIHILLLSICLVAYAVHVCAESVDTVDSQPILLTLSDCHRLAVANNRQAQIDQENLEAAKDSRRSAFSNFFPKFFANGGYSYNSLDVHLLSRNHEFTFGQIRPDGSFVWNDDYNIANRVVLPASKEVATELQSKMGEIISEQYSKLYKDLTLDVRHVLVGQVGLVQPVFLGGKLIYGYKLARSAERIAQYKAESGHNSLLVSVDEAYWRVVSVQKKKQLAEQYYNLLYKLNNDVEVLVNTGAATQSDRLKVLMKLSEAEEKLGQATEGLILSQMALSQLLGIKNTQIIPADTLSPDQITPAFVPAGNAELLTDKRQEIRILEEGQNMAKSAKMIAASTLMPNIVASANYMMSNRNMEDGITKKYSGWLNAGVVVNIPLAHASDIYKVKAAQHEEKAMELRLQQTRELLQLQITQSEQQVSAAIRKLARANTSLCHAREILRIAEESHLQGMITTTELMTAQTQWQSAEADCIDAAIELKMAELNYQKNIGQILN